jgi:hypothetical protein
LAKVADSIKRISDRAKRNAPIEDFKGECNAIWETAIGHYDEEAKQYDPEVMQ